MKKTFIISLILISSITLLYIFYSNHRNVTRAFYYWKSTFKLDDTEVKLLDTLLVKKIYVKYFDVEWNKALQMAVPIATIKFDSADVRHCEIVPTIYITNNTFLKMDENGTSELASKIAHRITQINEHYKINCKEIQFDCDWSLKTKTNYFSVLEKMRKYFPRKQFTLSATIRLHQIKYPDKTGVPPIDRGMLMYYNVCNLNNINTSNSIFNLRDANKYNATIAKYKLPLDFALPIFSWVVHFRNGRIIGLMNNMSKKNIGSNSHFIKLNKNYYGIKTEGFFQGDYFMKKDILRIEEITPNISKQAINSILPFIKNNNFTVTFFHLDTSNINRYETQDFENMYRSFN